MSSEMYIRWEVQNLENLHRQLKIQLEKEREHQAELFRQMTGSIGSITGKINAAKSDANSAGDAPTVRKEKVGNISDYDTDEVVSTGVSAGLENVQVESGNSDKRSLVVIDWSNLLDAFEAETSDKVKKLTYAQEISAQLATAVLESDDDIKAQNEFVSYLNELLNDDELDYEYFKDLIDRRFGSLKKKISMLEPEDVTEELFEYYALCELLGEKPKKIKKENIKAESKRLLERYTEKKKEDYVYQNLMEVFAELNMSVVDEMELDGLLGHRVVDESLPDCSIFMSMDGEGIVFETVAEVENPDSLSSDKKAMMEESAHKVCQKHLMVIRKMQERGIFLRIECEEKPKAERMRKIKKSNSRKIARGKKQEQYIGG